MGELRNQLKSQTLDSLTASSLSTVGGRVYPDDAAVPDLGALVSVLDSWRAVHVPSYGAPIPQTGTLHTHAMTGSDLENVVDVSAGVLKVQAVSLTNGGPAPILFDVYVGGVALNSDALAADPGNFRAFAIPSPLFIDENTPLQVKITSGTPTDGVVDVSTIAVAL